MRLKNKGNKIMSNTKMKRFLRKIQVFVKRNSLALLVGFTTVLTLAVVALSAYFTFKNADQTNSNVEEQQATPTNVSTTVVFVDPLDQISISKEYAADHLLEDKTTGIWQTHQAIDFAAKDGDVVKAVYSGVIEKVENSMMDGTIITLKIADNLKVIYKSLSSETFVDIGDSVKAGDKIGKAGTNVTEKAEGVHLHLEVMEEGKLVDPNMYFNFGDK